MTVQHFADKRFSVLFWPTIIWVILIFIFIAMKYVHSALSTPSHVHNRFRPTNLYMGFPRQEPTANRDMGGSTPQRVTGEAATLRVPGWPAAASVGVAAVAQIIENMPCAVGSVTQIRAEALPRVSGSSVGGGRARTGDKGLGLRCRPRCRPRSAPGAPGLGHPGLCTPS